MFTIWYDRNCLSVNKQLNELFINGLVSILQANMMRKSDRRKERTRRQLQDAMLQLLEEKHHKTITVQDVVDVADLGRTTFYLHYKDINDLLSSCLEQIVNQMAEHFKPLSHAEFGHNPVIREKVFQHVQERRALFWQLLGDEGVAEVIHRFRRFNAKRLEEHLREQGAALALADNDIQLISNYLAGAMLTTIIWWLENDMPLSPEQMANQVHRLTSTVFLSLESGME